MGTSSFGLMNYVETWWLRSPRLTAYETLLATTWAARKPSSIGGDSFTVTALWW